MDIALRQDDFPRCSLFVLFLLPKKHHPSTKDWLGRFQLWLQRRYELGISQGVLVWMCQDGGYHSIRVKIFPVHDEYHS